MMSMADDTGEAQLPALFGKPTPARMYDYYLGGKDNFEVDRAAADQLINRLGVEKTRFVAWENRRFLWRTVEYLSAECGISQFIDVGAGLPTMRNTHEIAQQVNPAARTVYVDVDPVAFAHATALLQDDGQTGVIHADLRNTRHVLAQPIIGELLDLSRPVGMLMIAVLHFLGDADDPAGVVAAYQRAEIGRASCRERVCAIV